MKAANTVPRVGHCTTLTVPRSECVVKSLKALCAILIAGWFFASSTERAVAADKDCTVKRSPSECFGEYVGPRKVPIESFEEKDPDWKATMQALVYQDKTTKIYTYVYRFELKPESAQIAWVRLGHDIPTGKLNVSRQKDTFDAALDWGIVKDIDEAWTSKDVDDCGDTKGQGCVNGYKKGFEFGRGSFNMYPARLGATLKKPLRITFYAQSKLEPAEEKDGVVLADGSLSREGTPGYNSVGLGDTLVPSLPGKKKKEEVHLERATSPGDAIAGVNYVSVTGSGFPEGNITPGNITVGLALECRGAASATTSAISVVSGSGDNKLLSFQLPAGLDPGQYFISISDSEEGDANFESSNCSAVTIVQ